MQQQTPVGEDTGEDERTAPCSGLFEGKASENAEVVIKILYGEVLKTPQPYYAQFHDMHAEKQTWTYLRLPALNSLTRR